MQGNEGHFIGRLFGRRSRGGKARGVSAGDDLSTIIQRLRGRYTRRDSLTGLYNARFVDHLLEELETRGQLQHSSMIVIEIVGLRDEVARFGSVVGNGIVVALSGRLKNVVDYGSAAARLSFSEFAVVMPGVPGNEASPVVERIREAFDSPVAVGGVIKRLPFRIGLGSLGENPRDGVLGAA